MTIMAFSTEHPATGDDVTTGATPEDCNYECAVTMDPLVPNNPGGAGYPGGSFKIPWQYTLIQELYRVYPITYLLIGLVCNTLCIMVVLRREMRGTSVSVYLCALAVTDNLFLLNNMLYVASNALSKGEVIIHLPNRYQLFLSYLVGHLNSFIVCALTLDRLIIVYYPLKAFQYCSEKMALKILGSILVFWTVATCHLAIFVQDYYAHPVSKKLVFLFDDKDYGWFFHNVWVYISLGTTLCTIPWLSIFNIAITAKLIKKEKWRRRSTGTSTKSRQSSSESSKVNTTVMLVTISSITVVILIPNSIMTMLTLSNAFEKMSSTPEHRANTALAVALCRMIFYSNSVIHFFLYCSTGKKFRKCFLQMIMGVTSSDGSSHSRTGSLLERSSSSSVSVSNCEQKPISAICATKPIPKNNAL